ncbi:hypothetical protein R6Q57_029246 [Mikania cordata]
MDPNNSNNPYFNPFMNCYRPQLDPNNPNPNQFLTFSNWYPQPPFFNQNSLVGDNVSENQPNPDVNVVPETQPDVQPASSRRRHRRKEVPGKTTKPTIIKWMESEEVALVRAYIDVSEYPIVGNNQTSSVFWSCDEQHAFRQMARDLQRKVAKFNGIWAKHHNNRKSGENDDSVMNKSLMTYARENGPFVMRKSTKWHPVPKLQTSKRTKTSSSGKYTITQSDSTGRCFVNLNESDEEVEMDMPPPTSPQRPPDRNNKGKRSQASSSTDYKDTLLKHNSFAIDLTIFVEN